MVIPLRINVNLKAATLEDLLHRRHVLHVAMFENVISEVEREFVERACPQDTINLVLAGCREVLAQHKEANAERLNDDDNYKKAMEDALLIKDLALKKMRIIERQFARNSSGANNNNNNNNNANNNNNTNSSEALVITSSHGSKSGLQRAGSDVSCLSRQNLPEEVWSLELMALRDDWTYYKLLSGYEDFKWEPICRSLAGELGPKLMIPQDMAPEQIVVALECLSKYSKAIKWAYYGACSLIPKKFEKLVGNEIELSDMKSRLGIDGGKLIGSILKGNPNATSLDLTKSALSSQGAIEVAEGLKEVQLAKLDLTMSSIGLEGAARILEVPSLSSLTFLSLRYNVLSEEGGEKLLAWLHSAQQIKHLDLGYCCIDETLGLKLAEELKLKAQTLECLDLRGNAMLGTASQKIAQVAIDSESVAKLNGCTLPNKARVWLEPELARCAAVDGDLMADYVKANGQLLVLNELEAPDSGYWDLGKQLSNWWANIKIPLAFIMQRLEQNPAIFVRHGSVDGRSHEAARNELEQHNSIRAESELRQKYNLNKEPTRHLLQHAVRNELIEDLYLLHAAGVTGEEKDFHILLTAAGEGSVDVAMAWFSMFPLKLWWKRLQEKRTGVMGMAKKGLSVVLATILKSIEDEETRNDVINMQDMGNQTALMMASGRGEDFVVEILLHWKAKLALTSKEGWTALHFAAKNFTTNTQNPSHNSLETLLKHADRADINNIDNEGFSALHFAAAAGRSTNVKILLDASADVGLKSRTKVTPLMEAVKNGHEAVSTLLIENNAKTDEQDSENKTALMHATTNGHFKLVELLLSKGADYNLQDSVGRTALMFAVLKRNTEVLGRLLSRIEPPPEAPMRVSSTAVGNPTSPLGASRPYPSLAAGAASSISTPRRSSVGARNLPPPLGVVTSKSETNTIDIADEEMRTALMMAASAGLSNTVVKLIYKGASLDIKDGFGRTALMEAARNGHAQVVEALLQFNANKDLQSTSGWTALMMAAAQGHAPCVEVLVRSGAATWQQSADKRTALDCAKRKGNRLIIDLLERKQETTSVGTSVPQANDDQDHQQGLYIVPFEVPFHLVKGMFGPRDKHDLMHSKGHTIVFRLDTRVFSKLEGDWFVEALLSRSVRRKWLQLLSSPLSALTLQPDRRDGAGIHKDASYFSFCHPADVGADWDWDSQGSGMNDTNRFLTFLSVGGFVYFNSQYEIVKINTLSVLPQPDTKASWCFRFDTSWEMQPSSIEYLDRWKRWNPVTVPFLKEQGYESFAWINPSEALGDKYISPYGGFAYREADDHNKALYRPITLDCDLDVQPGPEDPFTTKVDNTTEGSSSAGDYSPSSEPLSDDHEEMGYTTHLQPLSPEPQGSGHWSTSALNWGRGYSSDEDQSEASRAFSSSRQPQSSRGGGASSFKKTGTGFRGMNSGQKKRRLSVEPVRAGGAQGLFRGLVTGLVEVRKEVSEQLQFHLLNVAAKEKAKAKAGGHVTRSESGGSEDQAQQQEAAKFEEGDPTTWTAQHLPIIANFDSAAKRVEKVRLLSRLLRFCPEEYKLNIAMPVSLLRFPGFGKTPIAKQLFLEDIHDLTAGARKGLIRLCLDSEGFYHCEEEVRQFLEEVFPGLVGQPSQQQPAQQNLLRLKGSPLHAITLPEDVQVRAGIPANARFYSFCFPLQQDGYPKQQRNSRNSSPEREMNQRGRRHSTTAIPTDGQAPAFVRNHSALQTGSSRDIFITVQKKSKAGRGNPIACWLQYGAFVYFDATYEVLAVNALSSAIKTKTHNMLYLGPGSQLSGAVLRQLDQEKRWFPVAHPAPRKMGFTHVTWVNPCEVLADQIFTMHGGFAYKAGRTAEYFPILKSPYDGEEELSETAAKPYKLNVSTKAPAEPLPDSVVNDFMFSGKALRTSDMSQPGRRSSLIPEQQPNPAKTQTSIIFQEFQTLHEKEPRMVTLDEMLDVTYILKGEDGIEQGEGAQREGWKPWEPTAPLLARIEAQEAKLELGELAALRIYTTRCSRCLDDPVLADFDPHPLPATWAFLIQGIGKLLAAQEEREAQTPQGPLWAMSQDPMSQETMAKPIQLKSCLSAFTSLPHWMLVHCCPEEGPDFGLSRTLSAGTASPFDSGNRLMLDRRSSTLTQGSAVSASGTSEEDYGPSLLRIQAPDSEDKEAESAVPVDVSWLSVYPDGHVLYPPGAILHVLYSQRVRGRRGLVATVSTCAAESETNPHSKPSSRHLSRLSSSDRGQTIEHRRLLAIPPMDPSRSEPTVV